jgi:hypothetical protein
MSAKIARRTPITESYKLQPRGEFAVNQDIATGAPDMRFAAAVLLITSVGPALAAETDGRWSVLVITERGACDVYRWELVLQNGHVRPGANLPVQPSGGVNARGRVNVRFARGGEALAATGFLRGASGAGTWSAPTRGCSGRWRAERR